MPTVLTPNPTTTFAMECATPTCALSGEVFNEVVVPTTDADMFAEAFGHGGEDPIDFCPVCGHLGTLVG